MLIGRAITCLRSLFRTNLGESDQNRMTRTNKHKTNKQRFPASKRLTSARPKWRLSRPFVQIIDFTDSLYRVNCSYWFKNSLNKPSNGMLALLRCICAFLKRVPCPIWPYWCSNICVQPAIWGPKATMHPRHLFIFREHRPSAYNISID